MLQGASVTPCWPFCILQLSRKGITFPAVCHQFDGSDFEACSTDYKVHRPHQFDDSLHFLHVKASRSQPNVISSMGLILYTQVHRSRHVDHVEFCVSHVKASLSQRPAIISMGLILRRAVRTPGCVRHTILTRWTALLLQDQLNGVSICELHRGPK